MLMPPDINFSNNINFIDYYSFINRLIKFFENDLFQIQGVQ